MQVKVVKDIKTGKAQLEIKGFKGISFIPLYGSDCDKLLREQQIVESEIVEVTAGEFVRQSTLH